ncbi:MAG: DUF86 domain-containing protein [Nanoarchaeota archaeon]
MTKEPIVFIEHILKNIESIESSLKHIQMEVFLKNTDLSDAIIRRLEIISEATKNIPLSFRKKYSYVEWQKIAGLRDKLIHHYFGVDLESIWKVVKDDLPKLKENIKKIIKQEK